MARVTLQTIADRVGVSKFAVSRSLSGKDGVSEATRRAVELAAQELGYVAPALLTSARTIQLVLHDHDPANSEVQLRIQRGIQREAERFGHPVQMQWTHDRRRIIELAREGAGMILVGPHGPLGPELRDVRALPVVRIGLATPLDPIDTINCAANEATAAVGVSLFEAGHREIVFLRGGSHVPGRDQRFRALRDALHDLAGIEVRSLAFDEAGGFAGAFRDLRDRGVNPTALVAANDWIAIGAMSDLLRMGIRIPEDIAMVGYGDYAVAAQTSPQLSTIHVPGEEMGAAAVRLLVERIGRAGRNGVPPQRLYILPHIIERESSRPPRHPVLQAASREPAV